MPVMSLTSHRFHPCQAERRECVHLAAPIRSAARHGSAMADHAALPDT